MNGLNIKSMACAGLLAAGAFFVGAGSASATPAASGLASTAAPDITREASKVTQVHKRKRRHRHRRRWRHRRFGGPYIGFGFGYPYYYGGYYGGYPYYYNDYYYRPRVRRSYRGGRSCRRAHRACVRRWGYGGGNYAGCMRYEGCRPR